MVHFLDKDFNNQFAKWVISVISDEYYIMMREWYFAAAMVNLYEESAPIFKQRKLDKFTNNKNISQAIENYRISEEKIFVYS